MLVVISGRHAAYINTAPKEEWIKVLRAKEDLDNTNPNSSDICYDSIFENMQNAPKYLKIGA